MSFRTRSVLLSLGLLLGACGDDSSVETEPEPKPENNLERYCFPADAKLNAQECCKVQDAFSGRIYRLWGTDANRSQASRLDLYLLPFKAFFIIIIAFTTIGCNCFVRRLY